VYLNAVNKLSLKNVIIFSTMTSSSREQAPNQIYASQPILQVKIKSWHTVAEWKWDVNDDCCGICRMPFDAHCVDCKLPGDDCPPGLLRYNQLWWFFDFLYRFSLQVWGRCAHAFHMHCIVKWLTTKGNNQQCPMCRQEWQFRN